MSHGRNNLHILILNYEYPPLGGGAAVISQAHANWLSLSGYRVTVVTCSDTNEYYELNINENLKLVRLKCKREHKFRSSITEKLDWVQKAKAFLLKENVHYDFCMAHFSIPGGWVALKLKQEKGIPFGVISHGQDIPWFYPRQMFAYHVLLAPFIRKILNATEKTWVQSGQMHKNATRFLGNSAHKVETIPNGCDTHWVKTPEELPAEGQPLKLLFAARFTRQKRPDKVILTAHHLKQTGFKFHLTMAGDGTQMEALQQMTEKFQLQEHVTFTGHLSQQETKKLFWMHHVLLSPSEAEGMSIAILEALFSGLYVFCTPVSGNRELISPGLNGEVLPGNPLTFARSIIELSGNIKALEDRIAFHQEFVKKFCWENVVNMYKPTLNNAANKA